MIAKKKSNFGITVESTDVYRKKKTTWHIMNGVLYCALVGAREGKCGRCIKLFIARSSVVMYEMIVSNAIPLFCPR